MFPHVKLLSGAVWVEHLDDACTYFCIILIDVLVVGQLHQAMAQVVVGEDEETGFQVTVNLFQILEETQRIISAPSVHQTICRKCFQTKQSRSPTDLVMLKELQKEGGNSGSDADKEVDYDEEHIRCTGNLKPEGCWIHNGSDGPSERKEKSCPQGTNRRMSGSRRRRTKKAFPGNQVSRGGNLSEPRFLLLNDATWMQQKGGDDVAGCCLTHTEERGRERQGSWLGRCKPAGQRQTG